jgi:starch synthase (maltosyl-transferring)
MAEAALIYNLFPPLAGTIPQWEKQLKRVAAMGFTWIYLNPIHPPGMSGSLYAVKDYFGINPLFYPPGKGDPEAALGHFLKAARSRGLKVMLDLVINHTAIDSPLVRTHPEWYAHNPDGSVKNPGAIDPANAQHVTVWGDLAELEYWPPPDPEGLLDYWDKVLAKYLGLGFAGFRADAAYKIPGGFWAGLISRARRTTPEAEFFAETLGCRLDECAQLASSGFNFLYNSSKWWDFQTDWCLEQYRQFRKLAPSVSFPETHDTDRLAAESGGNPAVARQRYLFAAYFSAGLMIPMGFEFGFTKRLHVVNTQPQDWESPTYDLSPFITRVNAMKQACPILLEEGPQRRVNQAGEAVVSLLKSGDRQKGRLLALINATGEGQRAPMPSLAEWLGKPAAAWQDITPEAAPWKLKKTPAEISLDPWEMRLLYNPQGAPLGEEEDS